MKKSQSGFGVVGVIIILIVVGVAGFIGWKVIANNSENDTSSNSSRKRRDDRGGDRQRSELFIWRQTASGWEASRKAPNCPVQPILKAPADLSKVTSVLYPGQTRGGNYKPHGGLRFDGVTDNAVTVTAPIDGYVVRGTSFIAEGEIQYGFDIMNNCGVAYRIGHLREISADLQNIADTWPAPGAGSASQRVDPPVFVKQGEVVATKVGILASKNTFFDWGVFDYRQPNEASKSSDYQAAHGEGNGKDTAWNAVCWLQDGWLPSKDQGLLASLPAGDPTSGKNSDYCK